MAVDEAVGTLAFKNPKKDICVYLDVDHPGLASSPNRSRWT